MKQFALKSIDDGIDYTSLVKNKILKLTKHEIYRTQIKYFIDEIEYDD